MTILREAAQQVLEYMDETVKSGTGSWSRMLVLAEALRAALAEQPEPPPEAQTEAEQRSYTFGWFKALEKSREMQEALQIIATPQRPDGTWNRDREACRQLAAEALGFHNKGGQDE